MISIKELSSTLGESVALSNHRLECLAMIMLALIATNTTNMKKLCLVNAGESKQDSRYRRMQRFFTEVRFDFDNLLLFLVSLFFEDSQELYLTLDRTNWKYGRSNINILVLAVVHRGVAVPACWKILDKAGNSNTDERIELLQRFLSAVASERVAGLLCDREFIGKRWFKFLDEQRIPYGIRIKNNSLVKHRGKTVHARSLFQDLKVGDRRILRKARCVSDSLLYLSATRSTEGELVIVASESYNQHALELYSKRWEIESLFSCLKGRGFNFEDTRLTKAERIETMVGVLALTFAWAHKTGEWIAEHVRPLKLKKHGRLEKSIFRCGLDTIMTTMLNVRTTTHEVDILLALLNQKRIITKQVPVFLWV